MNSCHIHIGHHFFGAGNIGDDLMVAGFLKALKESESNVRLTCAIPFDPQSQRIRFPEIEWVAYDPATRQRCVAECDIWLGLGDSPFQIDSGPWFVGHLLQELQLCQAYKKPMYFLCVGVNNQEAVDLPAMQQVIKAAEHIWTRDERSANYLSPVMDQSKLTSGADLGYLALRDHSFPAVEKGTIGFLFNFEQGGIFDTRTLCDVRNATMEYSHRWLLQEVRHLPGSESELYKSLSDNCRLGMDVRVPDYANASLSELFSSWGTPEVFFSSRYHGALAGVAMGSRVIAVRRNDKISGIIDQLGLSSLDTFLDTEEITDAIKSSSPSNTSSLTDLANMAAQCCNEFLEITNR